MAGASVGVKFSPAMEKFIKDGTFLTDVELATILNFNTDLALEISNGYTPLDKGDLRDSGTAKVITTNDGAAIRLQYGDASVRYANKLWEAIGITIKTGKNSKASPKWTLVAFEKEGSKFSDKLSDDIGIKLKSKGFDVR